MAIALYDLSVSCFLQTLGAVAGFMEKGLVHCRDNNIDPAEIVETRLFPDMAPFRFQVQSVAHHSSDRGGTGERSTPPRAFALPPMSLARE